MDALAVQFLKSRIDLLAKLTCYDGEIMVVKVLTLSEDDQEVVYDLIETNRDQDFDNGQQPAFLIRFEDIASAEAV